ncbi:coiled-coil alpha-helical rod protein 1 isoform X1 [Megalops cyprinoides]|uniref:coiled-coil alpha-helical rod protein 1 isoform X1 n=1 Tax=Megalops cyprinoides TaxID=118141 RepID=UPI0018654EC5|nr:coiled-coil alpha-helical rod protein 1 isoform X1 [Megalops cyprinoides]
MERRNERERLNAPADFVASDMGGEMHSNLMPPSHFTLCPQSTTSLGMPGPSVGRGTPVTWVTPTQAPSVDNEDAIPWLAIVQAKQEILELHQKRERVAGLCGDCPKGWRQDSQQEASSRMRSGQKSDRRCWQEAEWRLETGRLMAETEGLKGKVEALKEATDQHREDIRERDSSLNRRSDEVEVLRAELCQMKAELAHVEAQLDQSKIEKEQFRLQVERLNNEKEELQQLLKREVERGKLEAQRLRTAAQLCRQEMEAAGKVEVMKLKEELEDIQRKQKAKLQQLSMKHHAEVSALRETSIQMQKRLGDATQESARLEMCLKQAREEGDGLKEELSQVGNAFDAQSTTLQRLRNYIGQPSPEGQEVEKLRESLQKLETEKEALQVTVELLTVRLNSLSDILAIQEKEMGEKILSDPLLKIGSKGSQMLHCWREKVFVLLVQLHLKDIELRGERGKLLTSISTLEQEVKKQTNQAHVLEHSLQDRTAELHLERVGREAVELELAQTLEENGRLKGCSQEALSALKGITEAVQRFGLMFEDKVSMVQAAQRRLNSLTYRLMFAKGRVDTIQGLMMRKEALWKVHEATKQTEPTSERSSYNSLLADLSLVCKERDNLAQELKCTPDLIERAVSEAREQIDSELMQLRQALQQSREKALESEAGRTKAEQQLQEAHRDLEEQTSSLNQLHTKLVSQQEQIERALQEKILEKETSFAHQLKEMESQLNTARREHTKAVVALRHLERQAERERVRLREVQLLQDEQTQREMQDLQKLLQRTDEDRNLLLATVQEKELLDHCKKSRTTAIHACEEQQQQEERPSGKVQPLESKANSLTRDTLLPLLDDLQSLSAVVVNSSEASSEEDEEGQEHSPF